jgi:membrane protein
VDQRRRCDQGKNVAAQTRAFMRKRDNKRQPRATDIEVKKKGAPTVFSLGVEILFAVAVNLARRYVASWSSQLFATVKESRIGKTEDSRSHLHSAAADPGRLGDTGGEPKADAGGYYKRDVWTLLKNTASEWVEDKCPQLGAALAYFTVFSLAPLILVLLAVFGFFYGNEHARDKITEQLQYFVDPSGLKVIKDISASTAEPASGVLATTIGLIVGLFGASGVFGQLQDALNTIWGVKPKPGAGLWGFLRARFLSFAMVGGVCFLLLVSLTVESLLHGLSNYINNVMPGGHVIALTVFLLFDLGIIILLFAMIFRFLPDAKIGWRDVWMGSSLTAILFVIGKFVLGLYLGSGAAGSAYGAASSLITLLLWVYYSAQILLFGAEFTQVYANTYGSKVEPEAHAVRVDRVEIELDNRPG